MIVDGVDGVRMLEIPTPFAVGAVNAYLLEGDPLTLVDTGPNLATSLVALERAVEAAGHAVDDLELLVVTHQHVDHFGLTQIVAERSGAEVAFLDQAVAFVEDFEARQRGDDEYAEGLMLRHGIESHVVDALRSLATILRGFGAPMTVSRPLAAGSLIEMGGRSFRVLHRPGHSPSDTVFHEEATGLLLSGDHLLSKISSNALETRPLDPEWDGTRMRPLVDYRRSLLATRELDLTVVLGGHGPPVLDHRALIDHRLSRQTERAEHILGLLADGPRSAHDIANAIWGRVAFTQAYLTLCEVLGHLDLLVADGVVAENPGEAIVGFEAV